MTNKGILIVFSGPSGVGKGTVMKKFIDDKKSKINFFYFNDYKKYKRRRTRRG